MWLLRWVLIFAGPGYKPRLQCVVTQAVPCTGQSAKRVVGAGTHPVMCVPKPKPCSRSVSTRRVCNSQVATVGNKTACLRG